MNTHNLTIDFGKHKGMPYTRVPVSYLLWMVNSRCTHSDIAKAELDRRGTIIPELDISGHAIDSASLRLYGTWKSTQLSIHEGLHHWLVRMCSEALREIPVDNENDKILPADGVVKYNGIKFVFEFGEWPVLKTVMPIKGKVKRPDRITTEDILEEEDSMLQPHEDLGGH